MSKPILICLPGASHSQVIYEPLKVELSFSGYIVIPVALPSIGGNPVTYDFTEDVQTVRNLVIELVEGGNDVILVMHGYSGLPGAEALQGLGKVERQRRGLNGGVVRLVFIMSYLALEGFQGSPRGDTSAFFPYMRINLQNSTLNIDPRTAANVFYNDLSPQAAAHYISLLLPQSIGVFWSKTTHAAWRYIPSTYIICGQDNAITAPYAEMIIAAARNSTPNYVDTVERCENAGHCVMLSQVGWLAGALRRAAGERV